MCLNGSLFFHNYGSWRACQVARVVKNPPVNAGDAGRRHGFTPRLGSYPRERMATHCRILAWKILRTEELSGPQSMGSQRIRPALATEHTHTEAGSPRSRCLQVWFLPRQEAVFLCCRVGFSLCSCVPGVSLRPTFFSLWGHQSDKIKAQT